MTTHGSPELDADAAKLEALGADPGPTLEDLGVSNLVDCEVCRGTGVRDAALNNCSYCGGRGYYDGFFSERANA